MLTRKRKRAGSGSPLSVGISSLTKAKAKRGKWVELLLRVMETGGCLKTYVMKIELADLKAFSEVDASSDYFHDHLRPEGYPGSARFCNLKTSPRLVSALDHGFPGCYVALLGSKIYSLFLRRPGQDLEFKSIDIDEEENPSEDKKWATLPAPPCEVESTCHPKLLSLRGRLYLVGALNPAALVFDPVTLTWSNLSGPPELGHQLYPSFEASLGEKYGKLLFYNTPPGQDNSICIYDVVMCTWDVYPDTPFRRHNVVDQQIIGNPVPVVNSQEPCTIYWLHKGLAKVFALDWLNMRISCGPIIGFGDEVVRILLQRKDTTFCHVWGQIFCLFWTQIFSDCPISTNFHLTFLRVVNNDVRQLTALVVGCHKFTLPGSYSAYEASLLR